MTPDEEVLLRDIGVRLLGSLAGFTSITLVYGVFVLLFAISSYKIANREVKSQYNLLMFLITLVTFAIATTYWSAYLATFATLVRGILVDTDIGPLDTGNFDGIDRKNLRFIMMQNWTAQILPMISDAIVVWRAWELYPDSVWVIGFPIALLVGTISSGLGFLGLASADSLSLVGGLGGSANRRNMFISFLSLSLATNVLATFLIVSKLWSRPQVAKDISRFRVVVIYLIETGLLYAATQTINLVLELLRATPDSSLYFGGIVVTSVYTLCTAMFPTIVILFVTVQRSVSHLYGFTPVFTKAITGAAARSAGARPATVGHLSFAARGTQPSAQMNSSFSDSQTGSLVLDVHKAEAIGDESGILNEKESKI